LTSLAWDKRERYERTIVNKYFKYIHFPCTRQAQSMNFIHTVQGEFLGELQVDVRPETRFTKVVGDWRSYICADDVESKNQAAQTSWAASTGQRIG
jgi:hypothetical protein